MLGDNAVTSLIQTPHGHGHGRVLFYLLVGRKNEKSVTAQFSQFVKLSPSTRPSVVHLLRKEELACRRKKTLPARGGFAALCLVRGMGQARHANQPQQKITFRGGVE